MKYILLKLTLEIHIDKLKNYRYTIFFSFLSYFKVALTEENVIGKLFRFILKLFKPLDLKLQSHNIAITKTLTLLIDINILMFQNILLVPKQNLFGGSLIARGNVVI